MKFLVFTIMFVVFAVSETISLETPTTTTTTTTPSATTTTTISPDERSNLNEQLVNAAFKRNLTAVENLLNRGADINAKNYFGYTSLLWSSSFGPLNMTKYLIDHGADINIRSQEGSTILYQAAYYGGLKTVKYLVEEIGMDVNDKREKDGWTALIGASRAGNLDVVHYLVKHGAQIDAKDNDGDTALDHAKLWSINQVVLLLEGLKSSEHN